MGSAQAMCRPDPAYGPSLPWAGRGRTPSSHMEGCSMHPSSNSNLAGGGGGQPCEGKGHGPASTQPCGGQGAWPSSMEEEDLSQPQPGSMGERRCGPAPVNLEKGVWPGLIHLQGWGRGHDLAPAFCLGLGNLAAGESGHIYCHQISQCVGSSVGQIPMALWATFGWCTRGWAPLCISTKSCSYVPMYVSVRHIKWKGLYVCLQWPAVAVAMEGLP